MPRQQRRPTLRAACRSGACRQDRRQVDQLIGEAIGDACRRSVVDARRASAAQFDDPRHDPPPDDRRLAGNAPAVRTPMTIAPVERPARRRVAGADVTGGIEVAQPAEAVQLALPRRRWAAAHRTASRPPASPRRRRARNGRARSRWRSWGRRCAGPAARSAACRRPAHRTASAAAATACSRAEADRQRAVDHQSREPRLLGERQARHDLDLSIHGRSDYRPRGR